MVQAAKEGEMGWILGKNITEAHPKESVPPLPTGDLSKETVKPGRP